MTLEDLPPLRDVITSHELGAKKAFGQHFLLDLNLTAKIARLAGDMSQDQAIEVGPGPGGLTRAILSEGAASLLAVEKDGRFLDALSEINSASGGRLTVEQADALDVDETSLLTGPGDKVILSNLPYNVGTQLLIKWLQAEPIWWRRAVLMFQREVADRVVARPGDKAYGRLAVIAQSRCSAHLALKIPARAFTPPPKVESAVVVLDPLPEAQQFKDVIALERITASAFGQRRKTLRRSLAQAAGQASTSADALLETAGIDPGARAEVIDIAGFQTLATAWRSAYQTDRS
ncbi:16S rRNA (adenine(1518)-N(6)/adenine(1519)-N(6))-dimethyltransferase RsmA [Maricaulis sp.]|uniref:16S rRNA (adenine(1518)-N(6)/adenine(1519)-N(6))- dimethyltransferase RsmA n=1 Tax=Maricaulis sp. TaxID=1486257 RepID=UPI00260D35D9|nr:16S rRNA (adenine(1518)-N(6)/adenine(1519)-N(6))-dimethyltransferase RsmA [Maricaulis sp.]MDF1767417.1 16S rRNA (adenine(1518)-N(6)/adenine(1519)-N(6))-dimethyltransferase RsmA [Maricaulis sp.]